MTLSWRGALMVGAALLILLGLGTWQLQRRAWKQDVLAAIDRAQATPPVPLAGRPPDYARVTVSGAFSHQRQALVGTSTRGAGLGAQLVVPLLREGAPAVLVDRGWVPEDRRRALAEVGGPVTVVGYVRPPQARSWFSPEDDPAGRRFHTFDPAAIAAALAVQPVEPFILVALGAPPPDMYPAPARLLPRPSNNHLSYAITWYGLAAALAGVALVRARRRPR